MPESQHTILITGVSGYWGGRVAARLLDEPGVRVIGLDTAVSEGDLPGLVFVQSDVRDRAMPALIADSGVTTICHLAFREAVKHTRDAFDFNVMGAINMFGAAAKAGVRRLVAMSSTAVYGARPDNPNYLDEAAPLRGSRDVAWVRYLIDLEQFYEQFRHTAPDTEPIILRFAHIVGPTVDSPMTRFLRDPWTPVVLGADPLLQFIHEADVVEALAQAALGDLAGPVNVAARPPLPLSRVLALVRKVPVAIPYRLASWGGTLLAGRGRELSLPLASLRYRALGDTSKMVGAWGFEPAHSAVSAVRAFAAVHGEPSASLIKGLLAGEGLRRNQD